MGLVGETKREKKVDNLRNFHKPRKKKEEYNSLGRGDQRRTTRASEKWSVSPSPQEVTTPKLSARKDRCAHRHPTRRNRQPLPKLGWPIWHKNRFHKRKLNRRPPRFRVLNRQLLGFRARKYLVTCNQRDTNQRAMPKRHPSEFRPHVKFRKLNQPNLRLRFRASELKTMVENGSVAICKIATLNRRSTESRSQELAHVEHHCSPGSSAVGHRLTKVKEVLQTKQD